MFGLTTIGRLKAVVECMARRCARRCAAHRRQIALLKSELARAARELEQCEARWRKECRKAGEQEAELQQLRKGAGEAYRELQRARNANLAAGLARGGVVTSAMVEGRW